MRVKRQNLFYILRLLREVRRGIAGAPGVYGLGSLGDAIHKLEELLNND